MLSPFVQSKKLVLAITIAIVLGCSPHEDERSNPFITNGQIVKKKQMPEIVQLHKVVNEGEKLAHCTGAFVSDRIILTAAHCVKGDVDDAGMLKESDVRYKNKMPKRVFRNVGWKDGDRERNKYDLALIEFSKPLTKSWLKLSAVPAEVGDTFTIVGFGVSNAKDGSGSGKKRMGENVVKEVGDGVLIFEGVVFGDAFDGASAASGDGDSGGPMLIDDALVAVTSGGLVKEDIKRSFYTDIHSEYSQQFFVDAKLQGIVIEP